MLLDAVAATVLRWIGLAFYHQSTCGILTQRWYPIRALVQADDADHEAGHFEPDLDRNQPGNQFIQLDPPPLPLPRRPALCFAG